VTDEKFRQEGKIRLNMAGRDTIGYKLIFRRSAVDNTLDGYNVGYKGVGKHEV